MRRVLGPMSSRVTETVAEPLIKRRRCLQSNDIDGSAQVATGAAVAGSASGESGIPMEDSKGQAPSKGKWQAPSKGKGEKFGEKGKVEKGKGEKGKGEKGKSEQKGIQKGTMPFAEFQRLVEEMRESLSLIHI
eukprot:1425750-Alexandrium_andersonii.AAC.1